MTKASFQYLCPNCNTQSSVGYQTLIVNNKFACKKCGPNSKRHTTDVVDYFNNNNCTLTCLYTNNKHPLTYKCNKCDSEYKASNWNALRDKCPILCKECNTKNKQEESEEFSSEEIEEQEESGEEQEIYIGKWQGGKPEGHIRDNKTVVFSDVDTVTSKRIQIQKTFNTLEDAEEYQMKISTKNGTVKNKYRFVKNNKGDKWIEVQLQDEYIMKCDVEDLDLVEESIWTAYKAKGKKTVYARRRDSVKKDQDFAMFHRLIYPDFEQVDHINRDGLDNRRSNLRDGSFCINARNKSISKNNTTGIKGLVHEKGNKERYCAQWVDEMGQKHKKSFSVNKYGEENAKNLAIERLEEMNALTDKKLEIITNYYKNIKRLCKSLNLTLETTFEDFRWGCDLKTSEI